MVQSVKTKIVTGLFFCVFLFACDIQENENRRFSPKELTGLWGLIRSDSTYAEIYFADSTFVFSFTDDVIKRDFFLKGDSIFVTDDQEVVDRFKLDFVNRDQFNLVNGNGFVKHNRIRDSVFTQVEWEKLLSGDEDVLARYRLFFFARADDKAKEIN